MLRRVVRAAAILTLFLAVTIGGAALWAWDVTEVVRDEVAGRTGAPAGARAGVSNRGVLRDLDIGRARFSPLRGIFADDLRLTLAPEGGSLDLEASRARVAMRLWSLARGVPALWTVDTVEVSGTSFTWSRADESSDRLAVEGLALELERIELGDGIADVAATRSETGGAGRPLTVAVVEAASARGRFRAATIRSGDVRATEARGDLEVEAAVIRVVGARFFIEGSEYEADASIDLSVQPFLFEVEIRGELVDLGALVAAIGRREPPTSGPGFGPGRLVYAGAGVGPGFGGITGEGSLALATGTLGGVPLDGSLETILGAILDDTRYEPTEIHFRNRGRAFEIEPATLVTDRGEITAAGSVDLDGDIDLRGRLLLREGGLGLLLQMVLGDPAVLQVEHDGRLSVPYRVTGPSRDPSLAVDTDAPHGRSHPRE
jgi:hypothetical protein